MPKPKWQLNVTMSAQGQANDPNPLRNGPLFVYDKADLNKRVAAAEQAMRHGDVAAIHIRPVTD